MVKSKKSKKLLWQYFISYLMLMLSVMIILLAYAWHSFYQLHSRILMEKNVSAMELLRETNESELSQLVSMAGQFTSSPNVSPFIYKEEPEKAMRLIAQLSVYQASNDFRIPVFVLDFR